MISTTERSIYLLQYTGCILLSLAFSIAIGAGISVLWQTNGLPPAIAATVLYYAWILMIAAHS